MNCNTSQNGLGDAVDGCMGFVIGKQKLYRDWDWRLLVHPINRLKLNNGIQKTRAIWYGNRT